MPALAPVAGRHTRLIGVVFFEIARRAWKTQGLHQIAWVESFFEGRPGEEETVGVRLIDLRQADEREMDLRQRFFASAP
ncbi:MAG: hypothetical protein ACR2KT_09555 [Methylocella sp.]|nr:MAG: hypothetical protein DLM68_08345 [Hyphomicrobiales bacterium]